MEQAAYRIPKTGEGWRHYKGGYPSLYTIVGLSNDQDSGAPLVVYTDFGHSLAQMPSLYVLPLSEFIAVLPVQMQRIGERTRCVFRFTFEREVGDDNTCPFIRDRNASPAAND